MKREEKKESCPTCGRPFPRHNESEIDPLIIPLSKYHIRCYRCLWPVAEAMAIKGLCRICCKEEPT